jgi:hypothetical protein
VGSLASFVALTLIFGLAHTQAPLYYSNQHQYFVHGLARAGLGDLDRDWLANTVDPTPLFSSLVAFTHRYLHDGFFQVYFLLLMGLYAQSLVGIFEYLTGRVWWSAPGLMFLALLVLAHAGVSRSASVQLLGKDYPWYLQAGVAGQYVLGPGLQPSAFGVLFLVAIHAFLRGRPWLAIACVAAAADMHSTYLPMAAFLTLAMMAVTWRRGERRVALLLGALALLLVTPVLAYDLLLFAPTDARTFAEAQRIIAHDRIPHHAQPSLWFTTIAALQYLWIVAAIVLVRRTPLLLLMLIPLVLSVAFTLLQLATGSDTLALLFPWRVTAILVPLATAIIFARLATLGPPPRPTVAVCSVALAALVAGGIVIMARGLAYRQSPEELPLLDFIREHKQRGDLYLLPVEVPKPGAAGSTSFTPPPRRDQQQGLISVDLQRFRLFTGAPIFVDFKSIPYKDAEVIEWWHRVRVARAFYERSDWSNEAVRLALTRYQITHAVVPAHKPLRGAGEVVYRDEYYIVYRIETVAKTR